MTALTRLLASTPFRLAIVYMGAFVVATAAVIGYLVWQANQLLTSKAAEELALEEASLRSQYRAGGALRLVAAVLGGSVVASILARLRRTEGSRANIG